jgi:hypothetical protein
MNAIIDTINAANAAPVPFAEIINGGVEQGRFSEFLKALKKSVVILISFRRAPVLKAVKPYSV